MEDLKKLLGDRIRKARIRFNYSQQQLADEAKISSVQTMSQIELGERDVKAWELFNLAKALRMELSQLLTMEPAEIFVPVLWRKTPPSGKELIEADFLNNCYHYALLEKLCDVKPSKELPGIGSDPNSMNFEDVKKLGETIGKELNLGSRPACSLANVLEADYGVKIWYQDLGGDGSAAATKGPFGCAVLVNSVEAPWRRNFSFAHELFHLITWDKTDFASLGNEETRNPQIEQLANTFAASVLLPGHDLKEALASKMVDNRMTYTNLFEVAREFDVSAEALVYRLVDFGIPRNTVNALLNSSEFETMNRSYRAKGERDLPPRLPQRFVLLAFKAYVKGKLSRPRLAEYLGTSLAGLRDTLLEYGLDDREDYQAEVLAT